VTIPEISVIIPAYNASRTVGATVDSVLAQTFRDFELIVIDDGSQDDTGDVVSAREDPRVSLIRIPNGGVAAARNRGLDVATGSYVAFLDADDVWQPAKLQRQYDAMANLSEVGLSFTSIQLVDDALQRFGVNPALARSDYAEALLLEGNVVTGGGSSVLARASVVDEAGRFDSDLSQCADWDMWLRLSTITSFLPLHEELVLYRSVPGTMSSDPRLLERDTFAMLDKFYAGPGSAPYAAVRRRVYANQWMVCAGSYLHARRLGESLRCVSSGLRSDPRTISRPLSLPFRWTRRALRRRASDPTGAGRGARAR
jgi:glycosyltransferase involved in cell wall biosynthesis